MLYEFRSTREFLMFLMEQCDPINAMNLTTEFRKYIDEIDLGDRHETGPFLKDTKLQELHPFAFENVIDIPGGGDPRELLMYVTSDEHPGAFKIWPIDPYRDSEWYPDAKIPKLERYPFQVPGISMDRINQQFIYKGPTVIGVEKKPYASCATHPCTGSPLFMTSPKKRYGISTVLPESDIITPTVNIDPNEIKKHLMEDEVITNGES